METDRIARSRSATAQVYWREFQEEMEISFMRELVQSVNVEHAEASVVADRTRILALLAAGKGYAYDACGINRPF